VKNTWDDFTRSLGQGENDNLIKSLFNGVGGVADISESPGDNDPIGKTRSYKYMSSGIELGFRFGELKHIHFFICPHEGYSSYQGDLLGRAARSWKKDELLDYLGVAHSEGGGKVSALIGYVFPWVKYQFPMYELRFEFADNDVVWKATLMAINTGNNYNVSAL
jgi:hypothetical protein